MSFRNLEDPLGTALEYSVSLPLPSRRHFTPESELTALGRAGLGAATAVFVDNPTLPASRWPAADAAFESAIARSHPGAAATPLVWARTRTAPRYP